jgi:hypothetical protein
MKWARVENNIVMEIIEFNPIGCFTEEIVSQFVECLDDTQQHMIYENGVFTNFTPIIEISDPQINSELADAYEAIASLYEMNIQLQSRLEVLENGL